MNRNAALIVIDLQNDYFPEGRFPLWNAEATLAAVERAIARARERAMPVILVQHVADAARGPAPFFNAGTEGVALHARVLAAAPDAPIVQKQAADSFLNTTLEATLAEKKIERIVLCGMMTQNCVTHTALSKAAEKYQVAVLGEACTTVSEILHRIALSALSPRVPVLDLQSL
jgi:nicotinamidase-related amidase